MIDAAKTKPFGFRRSIPGPASAATASQSTRFPTWIARKYGLNTRFIELAGEVNTSMPAYVVSRLADALNDAAAAAREQSPLLGMAYKKDVDDPRESPGFELLDLLLKKGVVVNYNDPHIPVLPRMRTGRISPMKSVPLTPRLWRPRIAY